MLEYWLLLGGLCFGEVKDNQSKAVKMNANSENSKKLENTVAVKMGQNQRTLKRDVVLSGVGLHSGKNTNVRIQAALPNTGIFFVRTDLKTKTEKRIQASIENVSDTRLSTTLSCDGVSISTVEHLLAGLRLMGIDNASVFVDGPEIPILDGSAAPFIRAIETSGVIDQNVKRKWVRVKKAIEIKTDDGKTARIDPSDKFSVQATVSWDHPSIGIQSHDYSFATSRPEEIASARTFGFLRDVQALRDAGLALGGSLENAVVLDDNRVLNPEGLRYTDEFVRHKVLDAVGDFALSPMPFVGKVTLFKAGHELHAALMAKLFSDASNYEWVEFEAESDQWVSGWDAWLSHDPMVQSATFTLSPSK